MIDANAPDRDGPDCLEPLRPDELTRTRIRKAVLGEAAPLLRRRRRDAVWRSAGSLARLLAPLAGAAALLFGWVAHEASSPGAEAPAGSVAERPVQVEELVRQRDGAPPALLTSASAPSTDLVLEATLQPGESP